MPEPNIEKKEEVKIPVAVLDKMTDYMEKQKALSTKVDEVAAGLLSPEEFKGQSEELFKSMMEDHEKAFKHENERRISFAMSQMNADPSVLSLKAAMDMQKSREVRKDALDSAMMSKSASDEIVALQGLSDDLLIIDAAMRTSENRNDYIQSGGMRNLKTYRRYQAQFESVLKAIAPMDSTDTANFVPTALSAQILDLPWLYGNVESLFENVPMLSQPYTVPVDLTPSSTIADVIAEATTNTNNPGDTSGQNITDGLLTFTAAKLRARMITSAELDEDSILAWLPYIKKRLAEILGNSVEATDLNGDTTATHQDTDYEAAGTHTAWKGLRKLMLAGSLTVDCSTGDLSDGNLTAIRAKCGVYGVYPWEGAWIFGPTSYIKQIVGMTNCRTIDKYGPNASIIKGEVAKYSGAPVIVSIHQREDLNAAGVDDGVTATKGAAMYVNKNYWFHGDRRKVSLDAEKWITTDQYNLVAFRRLDFQPLATPSTTYSFGAMGYNFAP